MSGLEDDLIRIGQLDPDWDGYGAPRIAAAAIATARWFKAVPVADGGVQIEMAAGEAEIEIKIDPDGRVRSVIAEIRR